MPDFSPLKHPTARLQRILVLDDDPMIRQLVENKLDHAGYAVLTAASGQEALDVISHHGLPHLAIVDIIMPGMDGFEFCRSVQEYTDLPVIMLTAVDEEETVIRGIERYAEDYIIKPFSPRELIARVQRILRRMGDFAYTLDSVIQVDDRLAVDYVHQQARIEGQTIYLTPTETKILYILMRNAGQIVTAEFLLRRLWPLEEIYEDTLRVHIHRLRKKLEAHPSKPRYILTERGLGYTFAAKR